MLSTGKNSSGVAVSEHGNFRITCPLGHGLGGGCGDPADDLSAFDLAAGLTVGSDLVSEYFRCIASRWIPSLSKPASSSVQLLKLSTQATQCLPYTFSKALDLNHTCLISLIVSFRKCGRSGSAALPASGGKAQPALDRTRPRRVDMAKVHVTI